VVVQIQRNKRIPTDVEATGNYLHELIESFSELHEWLEETSTSTYADNLAALIDLDVPGLIARRNAGRGLGRRGRPRDRSNAEAVQAYDTKRKNRLTRMQMAQHFCRCHKKPHDEDCARNVRRRLIKPVEELLKKYRESLPQYSRIYELFPEN
jgi:hypothetical protein